MERNFKRISKSLKLPLESRERIRSQLASYQPEQEEISMKKANLNRRVPLLIAAAVMALVLTLTATAATVTRLFRNGIIISGSDEIFSHSNAESSNLNIYCLSERSIIEAKSVEVPNTPKDIFDEWATLNNVPDVTFIDCVYDDHGARRVQEGAAEHSAGNFYTLSLSVSGEFSKYASDKNGVLLFESLRRTFYDYISFDELNLIIEGLTDSAISNGVVKPGMQADDGKILVWEGMSEQEICGTGCYTFELRYSGAENINGEMAGRLLGIYAISIDGAKFYQYDMANDIWDQPQSAAIDC